MALGPLPTWGRGLVGRAPTFLDVLIEPRGFEINEEDSSSEQVLPWPAEVSSQDWQLRPEAEAPVPSATPIDADPKVYELGQRDGLTVRLTDSLRKESVRDLLRLIHDVGNDPTHPGIAWLGQYSDGSEESRRCFVELLRSESLDPDRMVAGLPRKCAAGWEALVEFASCDRFYISV